MLCGICIFLLLLCLFTGSSFSITFPFTKGHSLDRMGEGNYNSEPSETSLSCASRSTVLAQGTLMPGSQGLWTRGLVTAPPAPTPFLSGRHSAVSMNKEIIFISLRDQWLVSKEPFFKFYFTAMGREEERKYLELIY